MEGSFQYPPSGLRLDYPVVTACLPTGWPPVVRYSCHKAEQLRCHSRNHELRHLGSDDRLETPSILYGTRRSAPAILSLSLWSWWFFSSPRTLLPVVVVYSCRSPDRRYKPPPSLWPDLLVPVPSSPPALHPYHLRTQVRVHTKPPYRGVRVVYVGHLGRCRCRSPLKTQYFDRLCSQKLEAVFSLCAIV